MGFDAFQGCLTGVFAHRMKPAGSEQTNLFGHITSFLGHYIPAAGVMSPNSQSRQERISM
jgi:hypothetical protein